MPGPNHIDVVLYGYRTVLADGVEVAQRGSINIVGATVADDAGADRTDLTIDATSLGASVEGKEDTLALRAADGGLNAIGESTFETFTATDIHGDSIAVSGAARAGSHTLSAAVTETRPVLGGSSSPSAGWTPLTGRKWTNATLNGTVEYDLDAPNGCTLTSVTAVITPAGAHGALPTMPRLQVLKIGPTGTVVSTTTQVDTSADVTAYQTQHTITVSLSNMAVDTSDGTRFVVVLQAETGGSGITGTVLDGLRYTRVRPIDSKVGQD